MLKKYNKELITLAFVVAVAAASTTPWGQANMDKLTTIVQLILEK